MKAEQVPEYENRPIANDFPNAGQVLSAQFSGSRNVWLQDVRVIDRMVNLQYDRIILARDEFLVASQADTGVPGMGTADIDFNNGIKKNKWQIYF